MVSAVEPPGHFMVAPGDGQATLKWNVPAGNTVNVKRAASASGTFTNFLTGLTTAEITVTNLNYTLTYHFALSSVSNGVESANTPVSEASGFAFGGLNNPFERFGRGVGQPRFQVSHDAIPINA